jgi:methylmalonyl-CoA mutase
VKPYYRAEDLKDLACMDAAPGEFPYRRGRAHTGDWQIREEIDAANAEKQIARHAPRSKAAGAEGLRSASSG